MQKHWDNLLFGLFFGIGLMLAYAILQAIIWLLSHARMPVAVLVLFVASAAAVEAQDTVPVSVHYPAMLVHRIRVGLWLNAKEPSVARVEMPGKAIDFSGEIPPTYVRGVVRRTVDSCKMFVHSDQMDQLHLNLPAEPVVGRVALAITATGTLTMHTGEEYPVTVDIPACRTRFVDFRTREAEAVTAIGLVILRRRP